MTFRTAMIGGQLQTRVRMRLILLTLMLALAWIGSGMAQKAPAGAANRIAAVKSWGYQL